MLHIIGYKLQSGEYMPEINESMLCIVASMLHIIEFMLHIGKCMPKIGDCEHTFTDFMPGVSPCPLIIGDSIDPICKLLYVFSFIELDVWRFSAYILQHRNRIGLWKMHHTFQRPTLFQVVKTYIFYIEKPIVEMFQRYFLCRSGGFREQI